MSLRHALLSLALVLACGGSEETPLATEPAAPTSPAAAAASEPEPPPASELLLPPATLRASVVLEPPRVEIGDLFTVEVAVVTPPGHRVAPAQVPKAVPGLAIVDAERPTVSREPGRWVHHQRFRARARSTGPFSWPALELGVEAPDGTRQTVTAEARPFEVVSLLAEHPERRSPFSFRSPRPGDDTGRGPWLPALLGSLFTLAALGLVALVRRVRERGAAGPAPLTLDAGDEDAARVLAALRDAEAAADPVLAADLASEALRRWAAERFRAPVLLWATTEELAARPPPFLLSTRYAALLRALGAFDALRFPPPGAAAPAELRAAFARAREFVAGAGSPVR
jgi:hypothetical protein